MWTSLSSTPENAAPSSRTKHSATLLGNHVYLFGGKNGNLPLKDLWQYSLIDGKWDKLEPTGDRPPCLQEHSAVAYKDCIYIFGGEIGFSSGTETPLWIYAVKDNTWRKIRGQKGVVNPKGRRGHSALVYKGSMIIYGGYQDLRGSSSELWTYHFATETWHLLSPKSSTDGLQRPSGRHKHSAILHDGAMWVFGGMTDLQERGDLWRWDIASKLWYNIKSKTNPGPLHSHAVCKLPSSMLVFGGESNGQLSNDLWRFHFGTEVWEKLQFPGTKPHPRAESIALTVSELLFNDTVNSSGLSANVADSKNNNQTQNNRSKNFGHNKVAPSAEKKYVFNECNKNYVSGNSVSEIVQNNNLNFLKEISKLSSFNLSRLNHKCSYSVLNSSHDSTESLLKGKENSDGEHTPTRLVKSRSANLIANNEKKKTTFSTLTPATDKMPYSLGESGEFSGAESDRPLISRDPISVPNLNDLTASPSTEKHAYLVSNENDNLNNFRIHKTNNMNVNNINKSSRKGDENDNDNNRINLPGTPFSQVSESKLKKEGSNYAFNKRCQSDSYSSHLVSLGNEDCTEWSGGIPKSASVVRFKKQIEVADELTSDYCSIETMNKVSSSSNYSQSPGEAHKELLNDYPELKFGRSTESSMKKNTNNKDISYGFSNPNYLGPEVQTILRSKEVSKILNSPPDSVLEDTRNNKLESFKENVELKNIPGNKPKQIEFNVPKQMRSPPRYLPLKGNPYNTTTIPIIPQNKKKSRARSAGRAEGQGQNEGYPRQPYLNEEHSIRRTEPAAPITVYLIGGKEQGQVTVFKRPISLWRLRLSSNVF